ncbi:MAG TPA: His/Gly/Thr/Pro-type tRNA ligase C-terminal domain-containing protein, partial [Methanomassiliicoccaceae archaeon]|nr:His/Gly/Thr/Pro-type tRNA ligase C-terminal domain-containing protein [Methanomassiliicoccaceae archaeon]
VSTDIDLMGRSLSKSMKYANTINARRTIIVGEKEMAQGAVTLRDMTTGEQTLVKKEELLAKLR